MKKWVVFLLLLAAILTLASCGSSKVKKEQAEDQNDLTDDSSEQEEKEESKKHTLLAEDTDYPLECWIRDKENEYGDFYELLAGGGYVTDEAYQCSAAVTGDQLTITVSYKEIIPAVDYSYDCYWDLEQDIICVYTDRFVFDIENIEDNTIYLKASSEVPQWKVVYEGASVEEYVNIRLAAALKYKEQQQSQLYQEDEHYQQRYDSYEEQYQRELDRYSGQWLSYYMDAQDIKLTLTFDSEIGMLYLNAARLVFDGEGTARTGYEKMSIEYSHLDGKLSKKCYTDVETEYQDDELVKTENKYEYVYDSEGTYCLTEHVYKNGKLKWTYQYERDFYENGNCKTETVDCDGTVVWAKEFNQEGKCLKVSNYLDGELMGIYLYEYDADGGYREIECDQDGNKMYEIAYDCAGRTVLEISCWDGYYKTEYRYDRYGMEIYRCTVNEKNQKLSEYESVYYDVGDMNLASNYFVLLDAYWDEEGNLSSYQRYEYVFAEGRMQKQTQYDYAGTVVSVVEYNENSKISTKEYYDYYQSLPCREVYTYSSDDEYKIMRYYLDGEWYLAEEIICYRNPEFGYWKAVTEKTYYKNGNLKSEVIINEDYEILEEIFYNEDGTKTENP